MAVRRPPGARGVRMDVVNPLSGNLAQSASIAQRQQPAGNAEQVRRAQALREDVAARGGGDHLDPAVESADATNPVHDEHPDQRRRQGRNGDAGQQPAPARDHDNDDPPHIDLTA